MITRSNLLDEYPRIPQNILPKALRQEEFDFIAENFDLLGEDEDIDKYVDTFIEKLNEVSGDRQSDNRSSKTGNAKQPKGKTAKPAAKKTTKAIDDTKEGDDELEMYHLYLGECMREDGRCIVIRKGSRYYSFDNSAEIIGEILDTGCYDTSLPYDREEYDFGHDDDEDNIVVFQGIDLNKAEIETLKKEGLWFLIIDFKTGKIIESWPKERKEKAGNPVTEIPVEVVFIKAYCGWDGKVKTKTQVYNFIKRLQKAIAEKKIRKTSEYAPQIEYIQNRLIAFYNDMKSGTKTYEIPAAKLAELKEKCNMRWADHVTVIREYINILNSTKTGLKEKAQNLLKKIEASEFSGDTKVVISDISKSLKDYLAGKTDAPQINEFALQGLKGLAGLNGLGNLPLVPGAIIIPGAPSAVADNKIVPATDFKYASFNLMDFDGKWLQLVGKPSVPFKMMVWGTGGSGKSTLAIEFARYLASKLNKRVLYVASEEGAGATLHEKMTRLNAFHPNLFIAKTLPSRIVEYDFIFCDSANSMQMDLAKFEQIAKLYPYLSWVLMFQTTKDGNFLGEKNWQHAVDIEVYCENGKAKPLKSRFGGKDEVNIF